MGLVVVWRHGVDNCVEPCGSDGVTIEGRVPRDKIETTK